MKEKVHDYNKIIKCIILLIMVLILGYVIQNYFKPFLTILILLFLCNPINNFLNKKHILNRKLNSVISIVLINILLFTILYFIGNFFLNKFNEFIQKDYVRFANGFETILNWFHDITKISLSGINEILQSIYTNIINNDFIKKGAVYTTDGIFAYLIGNIAAYFILADKYAIFSFIKKIIPKSQYLIMIDKIKDINRMLNVELILVLGTTFETIIGLWALGIPNSFILGLICGVLDILPLIGTIIVFLPLVLFYISCNNYIIALGLVLLYILLQFVRQILEAKFMSSTLKIHPLLIIISLYIGLKLFGIIGLLLGPLYVITAKELLEA